MRDEPDGVAEFLRYLRDSGATEVRDFGNGTWGATFGLMFHWTLRVGHIGDRWGYDDQWCYAGRETAEAALRAWTGWSGSNDPPDGWHRHPRSNRRRPGGDATQEYIAP